MNVIPLTVLVSFCLAGIFVCCFVGEWRRAKHGSAERDSLLPLDDEENEEQETRKTYEFKRKQDSDDHV